MSPKIKIASIVATTLAVAGIVVTVTVPEARCLFRLDQCPSSNQPSMKEVELMVQTESGQPLSDVSVEFKSKGAPERASADSNGYVKIKIPETDVQVTLRKDGFESVNYSIDLRKDSSVTRTYKLKAIEKSPPSILSSPNAPSLAPTVSVSPIPPTAEKLEAECRSFGTSAQDYKELISVDNKTEEPRARFFVSSSSSRSLVCKIIRNSGELQLAYALPDDSPFNQVGVKVYVDGNLYKTLSLDRGKVVREKIALTGASGYKLDFSVTSPRNGRTDAVYILGK